MLFRAWGLLCGVWSLPLRARGLPPPRVGRGGVVVAEVVVVADDNPAPPAAEGLEAVDKRG